MSKLSFRLHTRACGLKKPIVSLDVTEKDYHSTPLEIYITHWFTDVDDFIDYMITTKDVSIILIVSSLLADIANCILCPLLPQISKVYVLGSHLRPGDADEHVNQRYLDVDSLLHVVVHSIASDIVTHKTCTSERSTDDLTTNPAKYIWYQFFFDILSNLNHTNIVRSEMIKAVRAFHPSNIENVVSRNCEEFEKTYKPEDAIKWYTRTAFFYVALNRSLRSDNINQMFPFRYVISDLKRSMSELQIVQPRENWKILYRGQQMYPTELKSIESAVGHLIGTTTFWPTTPSFDIAYHMATSPTRHAALLEPVILTINILRHSHRSTLVNISQLSSYSREQSLIFLPGSLFRIKVVKKVSKTWCINLILMDETDDQFVRILQLWNTSIGERNFFSIPLSETHHFFRDLSQENTAFLRFQLLVDIILRLDHNDFAKNEMLEMCKAKFISDPIELAKIDIFEKTYVPKNAITWYTKDCFLYRLLNESLQTESIDLIVKLRYFIQDLHNQLAELHLNFLHSLPSNQSILTLYRGLRLTMNDLEKFRQNETNLVSINSFLSTTQDYQAALFFAGEGKVEDPEVSVIYEISVDTRIAHSVPFAAIEYKSIYLDEDEVLFSMAAVFRIGRTEEKDDRLWHIELTLTPSTEEHWNILTAHLKN